MADSQSKQETALAAADGNMNAPQNGGFAALANIGSSAAATNELDGLNITPARIKIPSGGGTNFDMPTEGDEPETVKEFSAVILHHQAMNAYYRTKYTGGSNPPDCGSYDGKVGTGDPGGNCKTCPFNQYGSGENDGKACKNKRRVYLLREGDYFPLLLTLPTGSLNAFTKYVMYQVAKYGSTNRIVTRFSLKKATNAGGIPFSQAAFAVDRKLTAEEFALIEPLSEQAKTYAGNVAFDTVEIGEDGEVLE